MLRDRFKARPARPREPEWWRPRARELTTAERVRRLRIDLEKRPTHIESFEGGGYACGAAVGAVRRVAPAHLATCPGCKALHAAAMAALRKHRRRMKHRAPGRAGDVPPVLEHREVLAMTTKGYNPPPVPAVLRPAPPPPPPPPPPAPKLARVIQRAVVHAINRMDDTELEHLGDAAQLDGVTVEQFVTGLLRRGVADAFRWEQDYLRERRRRRAAEDRETT